ncbi:MAG: DUF3267 domain-containing protein [Bacteroidaceae bacterium]|nr:DUF3267 domain-containing protein [Bacteroidaceae bacterium]
MSNPLEDIESKGRKVAIDLVKANIFAVVLFVAAAVVLLVPFYFIWSDAPTEVLLGNGSTWLLFFLSIIIGVVVHELIHGATWACFAEHGWHSISFGVMWKLLTPYCHCDEPLHIHAYMWGAMSPCILLGIIPSIVALCIGSLPLLLWGIFFISAAAGDIWMTFLLLKENPDSMVLDHPSEAGFYILDEQ